MTIIDQQTGFEQKQFSSRLTTTTRSGRAIARSSLTRSFVLNFHKQTIDSPLPFQVADFKKNFMHNLAIVFVCFFLPLNVVCAVVNYESKNYKTAMAGSCAAGMLFITLIEIITS